LLSTFFEIAADPQYQCLALVILNTMAGRILYKVATAPHGYRLANTVLE
jgi:hypothetical protein